MPVGRQDLQQHLVGRARQGLAVEDHLVVVDEHRRRAGLLMRDVLLGALAQNVERERDSAAARRRRRPWRRRRACRPSAPRRSGAATSAASAQNFCRRWPWSFAARSMRRLRANMHLFELMADASRRPGRRVRGRFRGCRWRSWDVALVTLRAGLLAPVISRVCLAIIRSSSVGMTKTAVGEVLRADDLARWRCWPRRRSRCPSIPCR